MRRTLAVLMVLVSASAARAAGPDADLNLIYPAQVKPRAVEGCRDARFTPLERFWELERASSCRAFQIRGYQPLSVALASADRVNQTPESPAVGRQSSVPVPYRPIEARLQLSVRTKLVSGLLPVQAPGLHDSLWFAYSQQSYWQILSDELSRPFRSTDHQPEMIYVYPLAGSPDPGWRLRLLAAGYAHHSNGQSLPLSRSWDRVYLMAAAENLRGWSVVARLWQRVAVGSDDDNPDIEDSIGRGEARVLYQGSGRDAWAFTVRHSLSSGRGGSVRLDWYRAIGDGTPGALSNLRWQIGVFSGYGDSIIDYNFKRTVLTVGISLLDF